MKLKSYMQWQNLTERDMAEKIGCSLGAVRKWLSGERVPRPMQMRRITEITQGHVTATDFFTEAAA